MFESFGQNPLSFTSGIRLSSVMFFANATVKYATPYIGKTP